MQTATTTESGIHRVQQHPHHSYRGRVRSGCLTCRTRKVKCDESRPICKNCTKKKRPCVYKPRNSQQHSPSLSRLENSRATILNVSVNVSGARQLLETTSISQAYTNSIYDEHILLPPESCQLDGPDNATVTSKFMHDPFLTPKSTVVEVTRRLENVRRQTRSSIRVDDSGLQAASPSTLISRDIELTTTMDILTAREASLQPLFSFFAEAVELPAITPYDSANWQRMKLQVVELGMTNTDVASAITAVSVLYKGQLYGLPLSKPLSLYHSSKIRYEKLLRNEAHDFNITLVATFLLCLFEFIHNETDPILKDPSEQFLRKLEVWAQQKSTHSGLSSRIILWLKLMYTSTNRGGSMGLISHEVCHLLPSCDGGFSNLKAPTNRPSDTSCYLYELLSAPIFELYFQIQMISGELCQLTHYHRSRATGIDQEEVIQQVIQLQSRLHALWNTRAATQRQTPEDLRSHLAPHNANPIITLIGICSAAFHAEFIEMERLLGDPVSTMADSKEAMRQLHEIIDGDFNAYDDARRLNAAYLRPLFLYAIECMDRDETRWAVSRLRQIQNSICRSEFFATFAEALSDAQLRKKRRVTSKYFCIWYFGVPPPFM